jgi:hypothetical protein
LGEWVIAFGDWVISANRPIAQSPNHSIDHQITESLNEITQSRNRQFAKW